VAVETGDIVLMKSGPADVLAAILLSRGHGAKDEAEPVLGRHLRCVLLECKRHSRGVARDVQQIAKLVPRPAHVKFESSERTAPNAAIAEQARIQARQR